MSKTSTQYTPNQTEAKWYKYWLDNKLFKSIPDHREPFTIVIPPPNVTGVLHMGHIMNNTIQDVLIRRARLQGKNACWVPGTDHASIATEAKVVTRLAEQGIDKNSLSREEFLNHAWDWTNEHGGIILKQLKKMGASCDWDRTKFTLDPGMYKSVIKVFVNLYNKGLIYRGVRMVNWDPKAQTAVSDEEITHKEEQSKLYYISYSVKGVPNEKITIATTRPETIMGDTAICVHPSDERFTHLHGKTVILPLINREIPIITDTYVDKEFGTGALKITPAHDENDYKIGQTHQLASINIFEDDGTMSPAAQIYVGKDRFEVRKLITAELQEKGFLVKVENYTNKVGYSQRTDVVIEPKLSMQWFLKMEELVKPAIENVENNNIRFVPERFKNTYRHWMANIRDWNISRQLWWGQQIPAYYLPNSNEFVVAETPEEAEKIAREKTGNPELKITDLRQDADVLDTWFSSWLWPISVFNGILEPENPEIKYYYPTKVLTTGHDIIFFWVARMIISGYEYRNEQPFKDVYFTGMVRDDQGRKMSKQLGNSPDPLNLIDQYGADAVRVGMLLCSPAGGDLLYNNSLPEQGRNFCNKIWNSWRLVENWEIDTKTPQPNYAAAAIKWFKNKLYETLNSLNSQFDDYRLSEALMTVYRLFKDEFSSWFLEIVKPPYQTPIDEKTYNEVLAIFEDLLKLLHPFMPFITEELWHNIQYRQAGQSIMTQQEPKSEAFDQEYLTKFEQTKEVITQLRNIRKQKNMPAKTKLELFYNIKEEGYDSTFESIIAKLGGTEFIKPTETKVDGATQFIVKTTEYFVPLGNLVNKEDEIAKLQKDIKYTKGFLTAVMKKLSNERFVNNAPQKVLDIERAKQTDAETKIKAMEELLASFSK